jgi:transposase
MAGRLLQEGKGVRETARLVGASPSSVCRWKSALEEGGLEALAAKPHPGRPARLTAEQKEALLETLRQGPLAAGFTTDLWTLARVTKVIETQFGVKYHPGRVWHILRALVSGMKRRSGSGGRRSGQGQKKSPRPRLEHRLDR